MLCGTTVVQPTSSDYKCCRTGLLESSYEATRGLMWGNCTRHLDGVNCKSEEHAIGRDGYDIPALSGAITTGQEKYLSFPLHFPPHCFPIKMVGYSRAHVTAEESQSPAGACLSEIHPDLRCTGMEQQLEHLCETSNKEKQSYTCDVEECPLAPDT
ncbi:hypothetical protein Bbelb_237370 [Branchiostoma belcheri]|nr:hypothetical protein Bbelb_237370 [Branchiostoma belcheri]